MTMLYVEERHLWFHADRPDRLLARAASVSRHPNKPMRRLELIAASSHSWNLSFLNSAMIPHNRLSSSSAAAFAHAPATAASSSTAQAAQERSQALTSLTGQFMLEFGGAPGQPPLERFIVPPRSRTEPATMPDQEIINLLSSISRLADAWQLTSQHHQQGGRTLTFTHPDRETDPRAPVVTLSIGRDNALRVFQIDTAGSVATCWFAPKTLPQPPARRQSLELLPRASHADPAGAGRKHRLTPPSPPRNRTPQPDAPAGPSSAAAAAWTHAGLQQQAQDNQASTMINHYLAHFRMNWHALDRAQQQAVWNAASHVPRDASHPGAARQHQVQAALLRIQVTQRMAWLSSLRQEQPMVIDTAHLAQDNEVTPVFGGAAIDGPHVNRLGELQFYLERQPPGSWTCAAHASRAMVGAPWLSMRDFARHEAAADIAGLELGPEPTPAHIQATEDLQCMQGVHPETVQAVLERMGMATHRFTSVAIPDADGTLRTDQAQFDFLDTLNTDRLLLQSEITLEDNTGASHWVAFRRAGEQWVLLDSLAGAPQHGVQPSQYLRSQGATHFNAIWPQHRLVARPLAPESEAASERSFEAHDDHTGAHRSDAEAGQSNRNAAVSRHESAGHLPLETQTAMHYSIHDAHNHWAGSRTRQKDLAPLLAKWNAGYNSGNSRNGPALLMRLATLCEEAVAQGRGTVVERSGGRVLQVSVTLEEWMPPVRIWFTTFSSGRPIMHLAPSMDDVNAQAALLKTMHANERGNPEDIQTGAKSTRRYTIENARHHWNKSKQRQVEFAQLLEDWNAATKPPVPHTGPSLLQRLAQLGSEEAAQGRGTEVEDSDGQVRQVSVQLAKEVPSVDIWLGAYPSGLSNVRLAPPHGDNAARRALLKGMCGKKEVPANAIKTKPASTTTYESDRATAHWISRANEFRDLLTRWSATRLSIQPYTGAALLRRLAQLCTEELAQGRATVVEGSYGEVHEVSVRLEEGMPEERIWFGTLANGLPNLRLAPPADDVDARTALLKSMSAAKKLSHASQK